MPLNPPVPRLKVINKSNDVSKIQLVVPAGDELEVSEDVLLQIASQNQDFVAVGTEAADRARPYPPPDEEDGEVIGNNATPETEEPKPRPAKRAAKRKP